MSASDLLNSSFVKWMDGDGPESDIVISSRVRLARNLSSVPFPHLLNDDKGQQCMQQITNAWKKADNKELKKLELITFDQISALDRQILVEKHLTSPNHITTSSPFRGLLLNGDGSIAVMINEEDHLRIQCLLPGLQLDECYKRLQGIDDSLERNLNYAFDERRGYLTSCPTNVGTGMRASVMLHLPAIAMVGQSQAIFQNVTQLGMTVRGLYGEGTEIIGNLFQLSNQITLGQTEEDIITNLWTITQQLIEQEKLVRDKLQKDMNYQLEDRIGRSYGLLTNARVMSSNEALSLLSDVRLGIDLGIITNIKHFALNELEVVIRPAHLQKIAGQEMDSVERDVKRAEVIKAKLH